MYHPQIYSSTEARCFFQLITWIEPFNMQWHLWWLRSACIAGRRGLGEDGTWRYCNGDMDSYRTADDALKISGSITERLYETKHQVNHLRELYLDLPDIWKHICLLVCVLVALRFNTAKLTWKIHFMIHQNHAGLWAMITSQSDGQHESKQINQLLPSDPLITQMEVT